ncbi:MAG: ATP-binding protein [Candidatus Cloacimonetes bacterium]|jgi:predicted ATPase|nr:ATP-binding protein [Candidatus Cloacimonadota bacterium]
MLFKFENLGPLRCAELKLSDLTIICGKNNTGKTYVTYTIYGFLDYWWKAYELDLESSIITNLIEKGTISLSTIELSNKAQSYVDKACEHYSPMIREWSL